MDIINTLLVFDQFWLTVFLLIPMILVSRMIVAGTKYSPILFVVVLGLALGFILNAAGVVEPGMPTLPMAEMVSGAAVLALIPTIFSGGQALRKTFGKIDFEPEVLEIPSTSKAFVGTTLNQLISIVRALFLVIGIASLARVVLGAQSNTFSAYYALFAFVGIACATLLVDPKAIIAKERLYLKKGIIELLMIAVILVISSLLTSWVGPFIALPQIFFAMIMAIPLGAVFYKWSFGPTVKSLLFTGLPVVLSANFLIGGSRLSQVAELPGMTPVLAFGFFGQLFWLFGGVSLLMLLAKTTKVRNLAPAIAGGLSHSGLTGACTAGDFGPEAAARAPITVNMPFVAHPFIFGILAVSAAAGALAMIPSLVMVAVGVALVLYATKKLKAANGDDAKEVASITTFAQGWTFTAVFGGMTLLSAFGMSMEYMALGVTSSLSHFGLFAATQGGMFGQHAADLLPMIFAMPFLVHPFVFYFFGKAMDNNNEMPKKPVFILGLIGLAGIVFTLFII
jgi:hypothetical protein